MTSPPVPGNLAPNFGALLSTLGVSSNTTQDKVITVVNELLGDRSRQVTIAGLRHGVLLLLTDPRTAQFLAYDRDRLFNTLSEQVPGAVQELRIRSRSR